MLKILLVGLGGGLGAIFRYALGLIDLRSDFPFTTLFINLIGAFAIGVIAGAARRVRINENLILFLKTGACGGFTTFSTFSLESVELIKGGGYLRAGVYICVSVFGCLLGVWLGEKLAALIAG